jgi:hypothetical protein
MEDAGGPRPARVRSMLRQAEARLAAGELRCASRTGRLTDEAARACGPVTVAAVEAGNAGQVEGAVRTALPDAALAISEAICMFMAQ